MGTTDLHIRDASVADAEAIATVHVRSCQVAYKGLMPDEFLAGLKVSEWADGWTNTLGAEDPPLALVAVRGGSIVGLCRAATPSRDEDTGGRYAEFVAVYVNPNDWRSGVGGALMSHATTALRKRGWDAASLWVAEGNDRAIQFYERVGFALDGCVSTHEATGTRELRMRKELTPSARETAQ